MKCPKCGLVTFDHLAKCPKCQKSFRLARRLSRRGHGRDPNRKIVLPPAEPVGPAPAPESAGVDSAPSQPDPLAAAAGPPPSPAAVPLADAVAAALDDEVPQDFVPADTEQRGDAKDPREAPPTTPAFPEHADRAEPPAFRPVRAASVEAIRRIADSLPATSPGEAELGAPPDESPSVRAAPVTNAEGFLPPGAPRPRARAENEPAAAEEADDGAPPAAGVRAADSEAAPAAPGTSARADARRLKERWIESSRERRAPGGDLMTDAVDPDLPDWYSPVLEPEDDEADPGAESGPRKKRSRRRL